MYLIWASAVLVPYWFLLSQFGGFDETLCIYSINVRFFFLQFQSFYWFIICRYVITLGVPPWQAQILYTKYKILSKKKFNVSTDNRYSLCKDDVETSLHVFIKCLEILSLWINSACISTVKLQIEFDLI